MLLQFSRFLVAGAVNTAISYAICFALLGFVPYLVAYTIAYVIGIGMSYLLMTQFVFRTPRRLTTAIRFPLVYVAQYVTGSAVIVLLVEAWNVRPAVAAIIAIVVSLPVSFVASRVVLRP
jgi:putative flippase GtrA